MDKEVREAAETTISHETEGADPQKPETLKPMTVEPVSGLGMVGWVVGWGIPGLETEQREASVEEGTR